MPIIGSSQRGGVISAKNQTYRSTSSVTNSNAAKYAAQRQALQQQRNAETAEKYQEYLNTEAAKREKLYNQISASTDGENVYISDPNHILTESQKQQLAKTGTITTSHGETISFDVNTLKKQAQEQIAAAKAEQERLDNYARVQREGVEQQTKQKAEDVAFEQEKLKIEQQTADYVKERATREANILKNAGKDVDTDAYVNDKVSEYKKTNTAKTFSEIDYLDNTPENEAINNLINTTNISIANHNADVKYQNVEVGVQNGHIYVKDPDNTLTEKNIQEIRNTGKTTTTDGVTFDFDYSALKQAVEQQRADYAASNSLKNKDLSGVRYSTNKDGSVTITDTKGTLTDTEKKVLAAELASIANTNTIEITTPAETVYNTKSAGLDTVIPENAIRITGATNKAGVGFNFGNVGANDIEDTSISYSDKMVSQAKKLVEDGDKLAEIYLEMGDKATEYEEKHNSGGSASGTMDNPVLETLANLGLNIANLPADLERMGGAIALDTSLLINDIKEGNISEIVLTPAKMINTLGNTVVQGAINDPSYTLAGLTTAAIGSKGVGLVVKGAKTAIKGVTTTAKIGKATTTGKIAGKTAKTTTTTAKVTTAGKKTTTAKISTNKQSKPSATAASENIILEPTGGRKVTTQTQNITDNLTTISLKKETPTATTTAKTTNKKTATATQTVSKKATQTENYTSNAGTKASNRLTESTSKRTSSKETTGGYGRKYTTDRYADVDVYDSDFMDYLSPEEHTFIDRIWMANGGHLTVKDAIKELQIRNKNIKNAKISEQRAKEYEAEREEKIRQKANADRKAKDKIASEKFTRPQLTESTGTGRTGGASSKTKGKKNIDETTQEERQQGRVITQNRVESEGITKSAAEWIDKQPEYVRYAVERVRDAGYKITLPKAKQIGKNATEVKNWIDTQPKYIKDAVKNATKSNYDMDLKTAKRIASEETAKRQKANYPQLKAGTGNENDITITGYGVKRAYHQTAPTGVTRGMSDKAYKLYLRASATQRKIIDDMIKEGKTVNVSTVKRVMFDNPSTSNSPFLKDRLLLKEGDGITVNAEPYYTPEESARLARKAQRSKATDPKLTEKEKIEQAKWKEEQDAEELAKAEKQRAKRKANPPKTRTPKEIVTGKNPQRKKLVHGEKVKKGMNRERVDNTENIGKAGAIYPDGNGNEIQLKARGVKTDGHGNVAPTDNGNVKAKQKILIRNDGTTETVTEPEVKRITLIENPKKVTKKQKQQKHAVVNAMKGEGQKKRFVNQSKVKKSTNNQKTTQNQYTLTSGKSTGNTSAGGYTGKRNTGRKPIKINNEGKKVINVKPVQKTARLPESKAKTTIITTAQTPVKNTSATQIPVFNLGFGLSEIAVGNATIQSPTNLTDKQTATTRKLTATTSKTATDGKNREKNNVSESSKVTTITGTGTIIAQATGNAQKQSQTQTQRQAQKTKNKGNNNPLNKTAKPKRPRTNDDENEKKKKKRIRKQKYYLRGETVNQFGWLGIDLEPAAKKVRFKL